MDKAASTLYVARQPIFDRTRQVAGFELLFRDSTENRARVGDPDLATKKTVDTAVLLGLDVLSAGQKLFLNCSEQFLVEGFCTLFPPHLTVVEVLETVSATAEVVAACRELKRLGYSIALDDFVPQSGYEALTELADLIKVDLRITSLAACVDLAQQYLPAGRQLLAEKVETQEEFQRTAVLGFTLFQGNFLSEPCVLSAAGADGLEVNRYRILRLLAQPDLDLVEAENVIKSDPALCYRLLRFLRSPAFYLQSEIHSMLDALMLLGAEEVRKWLLLVCAAVADAKPGQKPLLNAALVRAKFVELIAAEAHLPESDLFLLGLLSSFESILGMPVTTIAGQVAVPDDIRAALFGAANPLRTYLDMALAYEHAEWGKCERMRKQCQVPAQDLSRAYAEATRWAKQISEE